MRFYIFARAFLVVLIAAVFLHGIGDLPLTERSEARYAGVAWEMVTSGDYLTPQFNGIKHFHKPPLFYWSIAASMKAFGVSELSARLPTTLAALGVLALVCALARRFRLEGDSAGWLAVGLLACSPFFWEMGRIAVTDMLVCFWVTLGLLAAWEILEGQPSRSTLGVFWASLGLNFLTKGPVGPLIVAMVVLPYAWRRRLSLSRFRLLPGLALAGLIGLPWYVLVALKNPGLVSYFLIFQTVDRVVSNVHHREGPVWYYLPVVLGGFLPWSLLLPETVTRAVRRARIPGEGANPQFFVLLWAGLPVLFFSLITSKLPPYVLPCFPALALLVASSFGSLGWRSKRLPPLTLLLVGLAGYFHPHLVKATRLVRFYPDFERLSVWLLPLACLGLLAALLRREINYRMSLLAAMLGVQFLAGTAFQKLDYLTAKPMADFVRRQGSGEFEVATYRLDLFGLPYYVGGTIVQVEVARETQFQLPSSYQTRLYHHLQDYLTVFRRGDIDRYLVVHRKDLDSLSGLIAEPIVYSEDQYVVFAHQAREASRR